MEGVGMHLGRMRLGIGLAVLCASAATLLATGCGGDDGGSEEQAAATLANESPRAFVTRLKKLIETSETTKDCVQMTAINVHAVTPIPCPPNPILRASVKGFKIVDAAEYGTGAIVDYRSGDLKDGAAIVLHVGPNRKWALGRMGIVTKPSVGTSDEPHRAEYDRIVDDYLEAVRERDCRAFDDSAFTGTTTGDEVCKTVFAETAPLARRLARNPAARHVYQGGNGTYGFYTLETRRPKPKNVTISVVRGEDDDGKPAYVVLDVASAPTAAVQRLPIQRGAPEPAMSKSRKADD